MKTRISLLTIALALIQIAGAGVGQAESDKSESLSTRYSCDGLVNFLFADEDTVRQVGGIPSEFTLKEDAQGNTVLFFWQLFCDHVTGGVRGAGPYTGLTVNLESGPEACPSCGGYGYGASGYDIFQLADDPRLTAEYRRAGVDVEFVPRLTVEFDYLAGLPDAATVHAPWKRSAYRVTADIHPGTLPFRGGSTCSDAAEPQGCIASNHWGTRATQESSTPPTRTAPSPPLRQRR